MTPKSPSVLPSITNKSLMQIAADIGMTVEQRDVKIAELEEFDEVIACGTAVVVTPVGSLTIEDKKYTFGDGKTVGDVTMDLYTRMRAIQTGDAEDKHGWMVPVC